jgi:GTP:adenosylcobinamide-phosphate guanylyltransferase
MDAVVIAGGTPAPGDPLYNYTNGRPKALLELAGKPMIQWVLDALCGSPLVNSIVVIGLTPDCNLVCSKPMQYIGDQGGMIENIRAGVLKVQSFDPSAKDVLVVSSDIPGITSEMVDWVIQTSLKTKQDACYNVIRREVMEKRYPGSRRSYVHLKDVEVCGGDMNVIAASMVTHQDSVWQKIVDSRKNALKQASLIGFDTLLLLLFHAITLESAVKTVSKRLGITGKALVCPYAEIGMDVDKPFQLEIMRQDLVRHIKAAPAV